MLERWRPEKEANKCYESGSFSLKLRVASNAFALTEDYARQAHLRITCMLDCIFFFLLSLSRFISFLCKYFQYILMEVYLTKQTSPKSTACVSHRSAKGAG